MNSQDGFKQFYEWICQYMAETGLDNVIVGLEPTGHYWFPLAQFLESTQIKLALVNPLHVKQSKELDDGSQTKNDSKDPKVIAKLVKDGRYTVPYLPKGVYADLRIAWKVRESISKSLTANKNKLKRWFATYFPEYMEVFGNLEAKSSLLLLHQACLPEELVRLGPEGVNKIWRDAKLRAVGMKRATTLVAAAKNSIGQKAGAEGARVELSYLLEDYELKHRQFEEIEKQIEDLCSQIPETKPLLEIKGVGMTTIAGFFAEVGDIRRFDSPKEIIKLAGFNLRENSSGKHKGKTTISRRGRARLRKVIFKGVIPLLASNEEFRQLHEYYTMRKQNPLKKKQSVVAIGCKLIRVFWDIIMSGRAYDGQKMLRDIHRTPLAA
jgi:transposase